MADTVSVTPALHEGGRFLSWSSIDLAAQCLSQAREQLDPEFSQFMTAVAARLATPSDRARSALAATATAVEVERIRKRLVAHANNLERDEWDEDNAAAGDCRTAAEMLVAMSIGTARDGA